MPPPIPRPTLRAIPLFLFVAWLVLAAPGARAETVVVRTAELRVDDDQVVLNAEFEFTLSTTLEEALQRGIPLYFILEVEVSRPRWYWFDEKLVTYDTASRLSYNSLTRQYRIGSGLFSQTVPSLEDALRLLSRVSSRPIANAEQLARGSRYDAALRFRLDGSQLPKPIQISALATRDWQLSSDWYRWIFAP
jgi:hypothetical protein